MVGDRRPLIGQELIQIAGGRGGQALDQVVEVG
jgi:hypothetical protein